MSLWLVRTGTHGEYEQQFLETNCIYLTWDGLNKSLSSLKTHDEFYDIQKRYYPKQRPNAIANYARQARKFVVDMKKGDWVVIPSKLQPAINIAEITGDYTFDAKAGDPYYHSRTIKWIGRDIPRTVFEQDLLYSFGAFSTVCEIKRNDAERRIRTMAQMNWNLAAGKASIPDLEKEDEDSEFTDLERLARDQIAKLIDRRLKGHGLERLVGAILRAQGYTVHQSPEGPDRGIDLLAAPGPLGFGSPRICVQVKSSDTPVDSATLNQLIGAMQNVHADQGLLVSWGGFKSSVEREVPAQFFRVRLWNQDALINELLLHYDEIEPEIRAELPFKQIWAITSQESTES